MEALGNAGHRLTEPRRAVASLVARHQGHFTAADLEATIAEQRLHIGRATLFRTLELLTELGLLERIDLPSGEHAYVRCAPRHHHHLICSRCGRAIDIEDRGLAAAVADVGRRTGFRIDAHRIELYGMCADCQKEEQGQ
jgi:Fur family ferric uptake transcriptional regulator